MLPLMSSMRQGTAVQVVPKLLQCKKHINSASGEPSLVSFRSLCENPTRKLGKTGNISHFLFFGGDVAVLFQILVQQFFLNLDLSKCC